MVLRIVTEPAGGRSSLALHGWLGGAEVAELERVVAALDLPLGIDLSGLTGADGTGIAVLCALRSRGVELTGATPYVDLLLRRRTTAGSHQP